MASYRIELTDKYSLAGDQGYGGWEYSVSYRGILDHSLGGAAGPVRGETPVQAAQRTATGKLRARLEIRLTEAQDLRDAISALEKDLDPTPDYMKRSGG